MLPDVEVILNVERASESIWARGFRVEARHSDGREESYFMKVYGPYPTFLSGSRRIH